MKMRKIKAVRPAYSCVVCDCELPLLNGCEDNDFATKCEDCLYTEDLEEGDEL